MVTTFYPPHHYGGDAIHVQALARALSVRGHDVEVVYCEDAYRLGAGRAQAHGTGQGAAAVQENGVLVHRLRSRLGPLSPLVTQQTGRPGLKRRKLESILARDFDVVHFHNISLIGGPGVLRLTRAPVALYTLHEHWLVCPTHIFWKNRTRACDRPQCFSCCLKSGIPPQLWRYTGLLESGLSRVDALLSPSRYTERQHRAAGITRPIHVLPLFSSLSPDPRGERSVPDRPRFLFVGRVTASKGIAQLVGDFAALGDYDLVVAGDGDLREPLQRQYTGCGNIRWLGQRPHAELSALYRDATALVLPSLAPEVFPLSVLEALAHGTPALVRDAGGAPEMIERTGGGFVYHTEPELAQAVHRIATDLRLRDVLGARAREGYEAYYGEGVYLDTYLELVESIRKSKSAPAHSVARGAVDAGPAA